MNKTVEWAIVAIIAVILLFIVLSPSRTPGAQNIFNQPASPALAVSDAVVITSASCTIVSTSAVGQYVRVEATGTATGEIGTTFSIFATGGPTPALRSCEQWTYRESNYDCIRGDGKPSETKWTGSETAQVPLKENRVITITPRIGTIDARSYEVTCS